ncbi:ABC transporter substrate-binding protein [Microbacterium sp. NPDC058021]|uniref:ABC transporter substrate-binding protein n=1 Tax=Microbacterium sp. NPDC058021 TaxID=3346306 RepID=UPI0036D8896C
MSTLRTTRTRLAPAVVAGTLAALVLSGCAGREAAPVADTDDDAAACSPGFTDTEVKIGNSIALSGPAAAYGAIAQTMKLYFDDINAAGGLEFADGVSRDVTVEIMDDGYDPAKTSTNVRTLVEQSGVFALAGVLGTGAAIGVAPFIEEAGVPNLFTGTGSDAIPTLHTDTMWTTAYLPQYAFEVETLAAYIAEEHPGAKAAILYQNDDFGESIRAGFDAAFEGTDVELVAAEPYELSAATVDSQVTALASSGADVFLNWATGAFTTQSLKKKLELGWDATPIISSTSADATFFLKPAGPGAADGAVSIAFTRDITDLSQAGDPGFDAWTEFAAAHPDEVNPMLAPAATGYQTAQLLEAALVGMDGCTREDLLAAATSFDGLELDLGTVPITTTPDYPFVFRELGVQVFNGETWDLSASTYTLD